MKIGLWNVDHPEKASGSEKKERRFDDVVDYLVRADCDAYIITEANAAIRLPGYFCELSAHSPFKSSRRFYGPPNSYHQVAVYSRSPLRRVELAEPVNGLRCRISGAGDLKEVYGNVITIKDQWRKDSSKTYSDRLDEQIQAIQRLPSCGVLVAGDFNLRLGWPQRLFAHRRIKAELSACGWVWPTETRGDTVQHVLHSNDLDLQLTIDQSVKYDRSAGTGVSDHPFIQISVGV
ncbi:MAG: endonuclease/exonuclease/phosphatase family protein [Sedimentisphaerales bacterium]|jgi:hypothetical protein|nr:endonuclease/exonuclease/phosphatase family protein [Sedimentisphaerales bacterium]